MVKDLNQFKTPEQYIKHLLKEKGWNNRILSIILNIDEGSSNKLISGKRQIKADMALTLGELFSVPAANFLEIQKRYELAKAELTNQPDPDRAKRATLFGDLPISNMIKRGWIDASSVRDVKNVESGLKDFFDVSKIDDIEILPNAAKKTEVFGETTHAQLTWIYRVRRIANGMLVAKYTKNSVKSAIKRLSELLLSAEEIRKVPRILAESGIRFVIVESLPSAKIDGVCLWLDDNSPVIGMSLRYDRIDNFWFVLRHELQHVLEEDGKKSRSVMFDCELEGKKAGTDNSVIEEERIANNAAANFCVPKKQFESFIARKSPYFSERDILGFSATLKIHPGLVAGQIQRHTGRYNTFRKHLIKVRHIILPSASSDGWGDVYPIDDY